MSDTQIKRAIGAAYANLLGGGEVDCSSREAAAAIAAAFFVRAPHCEKSLGPPHKMGRTFLIPALTWAASSWDRPGAESPWSGTARAPCEWPKGRPNLAAVTDNGPGSNCVVVLQLRSLDPAKYRGTKTKIFPRMLEARLVRLFPADRGVYRANTEQVVPFGLGATPIRADGLADPHGIGAAVSLILSLAADHDRRWERAALDGRGLALDVASQNGGPASEAAAPPNMAEADIGRLAELVELAFSP